MTLDELNSTLAAALASGRVGAPVSLRLHLQAAMPPYDSVAQLDLLMPLLHTSFSALPSRLFARRNAIADQLTVLFNFTGGQTALVTCGCGTARQTSLQLLLVGNRGVVRLEGGELFDPAASSTESDTPSFRPFIESSIADNQPVTVEFR